MTRKTQKWLEEPTGITTTPSVQTSWHKWDWLIIKISENKFENLEQKFYHPFSSQEQCLDDRFDIFNGYFRFVNENLIFSVL